MTTTTNAARDCFVAIELSQKSWLIGILRPDDTKVSTRMVGPGDTAALLAELEKAFSRRQTTATDPLD